MRKDSNREVLEALYQGRKSIYETFKYIKEKFPKATYPPAWRMVKKLEKDGLIQEVKDVREVSPRKARFYEITTNGLAQLYFLRKGNRDDLEFHRSKEAKEIIDRIFQHFFAHIFPDEHSKNMFLRTLHASPSLMEFFHGVEEEALFIVPIEDIDLFTRIINTWKESGFQSVDLLIDVIPNKNIFFIKEFYLKILPLTYLAKDIIKYDDDEIKEILFEYLIEKNKEEAENKKKRYKRFLRDYIEAVKEGLIKIDEPLEEQMKKFNKYVEGKSRKLEECVKNWVIYIPPVGLPMLACKGCLEQLK